MNKDRPHRLDLIASISDSTFFDYILRNDKSYAQKWNYLRENPMRGPCEKCGITANAKEKSL